MPNSRGEPSYYEVLTQALNDVSERGYVSQDQVDFWSEQLRRAAERTLRPIEQVEQMVRDSMGAVFSKYVSNGGIIRINPGVSAFTLERIKPALHQELSNRIAASIDLIKLNREKAVQEQQSRFRGWATSVPAGGAPKTGKARIDKIEQKSEIRKSLASMPYADRRVQIDQAAKLVSAINTTVAVNGGAIGAIWHSHKYQKGYNGRKDHNERDDKFFLVRGSWAAEAGLVRAGRYPYTDSVEQPAELPFCKCSWQYLYSLRSLPSDALTAKGVETMAEARRKVLANAS